MDVKKNINVLSAIWILVILASLAWNYFGYKREQTVQAQLTARSFFDQIVITRKWNSRHGGVYALVPNETETNPYLNEQEHDIVIDSSHRMMTINPAFMTRQLSEIAEESSGVKFHLTSLKPLRPANKSTTRERNYLRQFEQGIEEGGEFFQKDGESFYFYMAPLVTEKGCLKCHEKQGYKEGDIRGGISVTVPYFESVPVKIIIISHIIIGLFGLGGLFLVGKKLTDSFNIIRRQAVMDALTGIPNWRSFTESILREFNRSRRENEALSIIMCDIDNFKAYNDCYGHSAGDECLVHVANGVKISLRRPGDFCARYGGEEFVVILANTGLEGAMRVAERIRITVEEMKIRHSDSLAAEVVTVSLGVATIEDGGIDSHKKLIKNADMALYQAKRGGKNQIQYYKNQSGSVDS
jgi:diguanylate cyclase (GGDEF)-like protein